MLASNHFIRTFMHLVIGALSVYAQESASVVGTVTDSSGAALPGVIPLPRETFTGADQVLLPVARLLK